MIIFFPDLINSSAVLWLLPTYLRPAQGEEPDGCPHDARQA